VRDDPDAGGVVPAEPLHEPRAPLLGALVAAMAIPILMPEKYSPGPRWLLPVVELAFLVAAAAADPGRIDGRSTQVRRLRIALVVVVAGGAAWATMWLLLDLVRGDPDTDQAGELLMSGGLVWTGLVIAFSFLYWEFDGGGPGRRAHEPPDYPDLAFPQHLSPEVSPPGWRPVYVDYLYLGFTNGMAFSPTDVMPLAHWAKVAMGVQSGAALVIIGLVVARAVNILG